MTLPASWPLCAVGAGTGPPLAKAASWASKSLSPVAPLPDDDWYVATTTRLTRARSCSGLTATVSGIATQLGLATMRFGMLLRAAALTSGTTSGTSGSMRHAEELSTTMAPALAAMGLNSRLIDDGVLDRTRSTPLN